MKEELKLIVHNSELVLSLNYGNCAVEFHQDHASASFSYTGKSWNVQKQMIPSFHNCPSYHLALNSHQTGTARKPAF